MFEFIGGVIILIIVIAAISFFFTSQRKKLTKQNFNQIDAFLPSHIFCSDCSKTGIAIDSQQHKIAFSDKIGEISLYHFKQLISVEIIINEQSIHKSNRGSQIVGGAIGGLLLGGAGLLLGGLTGSKRTEDKISKIAICIGVLDIDTPSHEVIFYDSSPIKKTGYTGQAIAEEADEWLKRLDVVMALDDK